MTEKPKSGSTANNSVDATTNKHKSDDVDEPRGRETTATFAQTTLLRTSEPSVVVAKKKESCFTSPISRQVNYDR